MGRWADRAAELSAKYRTNTDDADSAICADRADPAPSPPPNGAIGPIGASVRPFAPELARLVGMARPLALHPARWDQVSRDAVAFTDRWGGTAAALGWSALALLGCSPGFARRLDRDGLLWLLEGRAVVELRADAAVIATPSGGRLSYYRRDRAGAVLPWDAGGVVEFCPHSILPDLC